MNFSSLVLITILAFSMHSNLYAQVRVYVAGYENNTKNSECISIAKYWKDGIPVSLTDGTYNAFCKSIYIDGVDIYTCGGIKNSSGNTIPVYWKDGTQMALDVTSGSAFANKIIVQKSMVCVSVESDGWGKIASDYWKGDQPVKLNKPDEVVSVKSLLVDEKNRVHAAGVQMIGKGDGCMYPVAAYWFDGKETLLTNTKHESIGNCIFMQGSDIYIAGYETHLSANGNFSDGTIATYWKNGKTIHVSEPNQYHYATSVFVENGDVYIAGYERNTETGRDIAKYWKNGKQFTLTDGKYHSRANAIFVHNNNVYVAGEINTETDPIKLASTETGLNKVAVYWKDGIMTALTDKSNDASASDIFVK